MKELKTGKIAEYYLIPDQSRLTIDIACAHVPYEVMFGLMDAAESE